VLRHFCKSAAGVVVALFIGHAPAGAKAADVWQSLKITTGFDYSSGKYGDPVRTAITYIPFTARYEHGPWTIKATVPWISIDGPGTVVGGGDTGPIVQNSAAVVRSRQSGLGDVVLGLTYSLEKLYERGWFIDFTGKLKAPTASAQKNLGTGNADFTVQIDIAKTIGKFMPFGTLGYKFVGSSTTFQLNNILIGSIGAAYKVAPTTSLGLSFDYRQSATTRPDSRELFGYINYRITGNWSANLYGTVGLSDSSPDTGIGLQFSYRTR